MRAGGKRTSEMVLLVVLALVLACTMPIRPPPAPTWAPPAPAVFSSSTPAPAKPTPTPLPTRTRPPAPTPLPPTEQPPAPELPEELAITGLNTVPPEDVSREMFVFGGGLGIESCRPPAELARQVFSTRQPDVVVLSICWDDPGQSAGLEVTDPQGRVDAVTLPVTAAGSERTIHASYQIGAARPPGRYTFTLTGQSQSAVIHVDVEPLVYPVVYEEFPSPFLATSYTIGPRHRLHLAGFQPGEPLRLWVYRVISDLSFVGWQEIQAGQDGQLWLDTDFPVGENDYLGIGVTGPFSGEVHLVELQLTRMVDSLPGQIQCPGLSPSRLAGSQSARALRAVDVFRDIGGQMVSGALEPGEAVQLETGPQCANQNWWWFIIDEEARSGFVPEMSGGQPLLEPVE